MTAALVNLKWVLGGLVETDRHFVHYTKKAKLKDVLATRAGGNVFEIRFEFDDKSHYDVTLKTTKVVESLFYENYSIQSGFPMARYYLRKDNMLVMQNLDRFAVQNGIHASLNKQQVYALADHLADLHAFYLLSNAHKASWMPAHQPLQIEDFNCAAGRLVHLLSHKDALSLSSYLKYPASQHCKTVCVHGNFTSANIFWQMDEDRFASNNVAAVIDWKDVHLGSPTDDLAQLLVTCVDADERLFIQQNAIERYYNTLRSHLSQSDDLLNCFTLEKVMKAFKHSFINQTINFVMNLQDICTALQERSSGGVADAAKGKLALRAKFAVMEAVDYANANV